MRYDRATFKLRNAPRSPMDDYQYECASPEAAEMARVIADLFPEQTLFVERSDAPAAHVLDVHLSLIHI